MHYPLHQFRSHREILSGTWLNSGSIPATEIAALAGFDWVLIDLEHGNGSEGEAALQILAATAGGSSPVVRVSGVIAGEIKRILDHGPAGIMIPSIDTPTQAREAVRHVRIPPLGIRQTATSTRAVAYGRTYAHYQSATNSELVLMLQIESREAVSNADSIASVEGVDVIFVGPTDLGSSMGIDPNSGKEEFETALRSVAEAAGRYGKDSGILARTEEQARRYAGYGFRWIAMGSDRGILASGFDRAYQVLASLQTQAGEP